MKDEGDRHPPLSLIMLSIKGQPTVGTRRAASSNAIYIAWYDDAARRVPTSMCIRVK